MWRGEVVVKYQVIDNRDKTILFESENELECENYMDELWEEDSTQFIYSTIHGIES